MNERSMLARPDDIAIKFLKLILPERGCYIAAIKRRGAKGFRPSTFARTIEDLSCAIENANRDGYETYHACASFNEARNDPHGTPDGQKRFGRTKHNVLAAKAFWLDIDVGSTKHYSSQNDALDALAAFCQIFELPAPICVGSGSGLHVYWPLQHSLDRPTWERYASGLKNLCRQYELHVDAARTADISSVLRTPGTNNRKRGKAQLVECAPEFLEIQPYAIEQFDVFAANADTPQVPMRAAKGPFELVGGPARLLNRPSRSITEDALAGLEVHRPAFGDKIVEYCGQLRKLRDERGNLPEPLWYASLGVLAFCEDGDARAHEWSRGYAGYTEQETQERLLRARTLSGATTCERFHSLSPKICERCTHWEKINSPIKLGWRPEPTPILATAKGGMDGENANHALPSWEWTQGGALKPKSYVNAVVALNQLSIRFRHDVFHNKKIVEGDVVENFGPELSDATCRALRDLVIARYRVDCGIENIQQAAERACEANRFDPVLDYLASVRWDGIARIDRWLVAYLGAEDTPLNHSIGRKMLIAAVRRARQPGCKFDYVVVFEGKQGTGKSSALRILAGEDNFSDQPLLHLETRAQQEAMEGVWIYELSELVGLRRTEIETVKGFISKTADNARPAYGRFRNDQPRRYIFVGTTNDNEYLRDATGNRRFWPVKTGAIALEDLRNDRDQLWAEAALVEAQGEPLVIPEHLYGAAANQQDQRLMKDPWEDILAGVTGKIVNIDGVNVEERIASHELQSAHLRLSADKMNDGSAKRLRDVMQRLGWQGPKKMRFETEAWEHGTKVKRSVTSQGYWRPSCSG
jgi:hypothetical protein